MAGRTETPRGTNVVELSHVTLRYGAHVALDDVSLVVREGERICVLGANGSGKSTLASVICGLLAPDEGVVRIANNTVFDENGPDFAAYRQARRETGLVFQNPDDQIVTSIVEEDVAFGPENLCLPSDEIGRRVRRELERVAMQDYARSDPSKLSGGQKQRVAIAGALAMEPHVLVLDEPGALLDVRGRRGVMRVMARLKAEGTTIVHITHFMAEALEADRVIVLDKGRVVLDGTPAEVFAHGDQIFGLGLEEPFAARLAQELRSRGVDTPWTCDADELREALRPLAAGAADLDAAAPGEPAALSGETDLVARDVSFTYQGRQGRLALDSLSFEVARGSSVAIVGQTGSGKSTLVRLLCALEVPDQGSIEVHGISTSTKRGRKLLHGRIGYVMQHPERQLFAETVLEDVAYGPTNLGLSADEVARRCKLALKLVGLRGREQDSPFKLSGGQQRLCAIAGIIAMEPTTLVLDEPTAGLDPRGRAQLEHILDDIHSQGVTVIRVTHSMDQAALADQVIVLSQSKLLMKGPAREVFSPRHATTLHDAGLGLPEALQWAMELGLDATPLTLEALVDALVPSEAATPRTEEVGHGV